MSGRSRVAQVVLLGEAPGRGADPTRPLVGGRSGGRLQAAAGMTLRQYVEAFARVNLIDVEQVRDGKGSAFPMDLARERASVLADAFAGRRVLFVGRRVARAFGLRSDYLVWNGNTRFEWAIIPHPSGINQWWNDPENVERAGRFLRAAAGMDMGAAR